MEYWYIVLAFFLVALVYSSVGFGGGSSYAAILSLFGLAYFNIRAIALICNIVVVTSGTYLFYKKGLIPFKKAWPIVLLSVPMAFIGAYFPIKQNQFDLLLAIALLIAGILMFIEVKRKNIKQEEEQFNNPYVNGGLGGAVGLFAGMVGNGGGIFLAPILHFLKWDKAKLIAATASLFILANSVSGFIGQLASHAFELDWNLLFQLMFAVFFGGQVGSRLSINWFSPIIIKRITGVIILIVSLRLFYNYFNL